MTLPGLETGPPSLQIQCDNPTLQGPHPLISKLPLLMVGDVVVDTKVRSSVWEPIPNQPLALFDSWHPQSPEESFSLMP